MNGCKSKQSCRELFYEFGIFPLPIQYIFTLLIFINKNKKLFITNSEVHNYTTRQQTNFHQPLANITKYQKGISYLGIKVFNKLPQYLKKESDNPKKFKTALKNYLSTKSFYSLQEYFEM